MNLEIAPGETLYAVISYNLTNCRYVGVVKFSEIEAIGKNCPRLDLDLQRERLFVTVSILGTSHDLNKMHQMAKNLKAVLNPVYDGSQIDNNVDNFSRPNFMDSETQAVFASIPDAARALNVNTVGASKAVNRPRYLPRIGRPATFYLVTTHREATHFPPKRNDGGSLTKWRNDNGYAECNDRYDNHGNRIRPTRDAAK